MILDVVMIVLARKYSGLWDVAEHSPLPHVQDAARDLLFDVEIITDRHHDPHILNKALALYGRLISSTLKRLDPFVGALIHLIWQLSSVYDIIGKKMRLDGLTSRETLLSASVMTGRSAFAAPSVWANIGWYHIVQEGLDLFLTLKDVESVDLCMENSLDADIIEAIKMPGVPLHPSGTTVWLFTAGVLNFLENCRDDHIGLLVEPTFLADYPGRVFTFLGSFYAKDGTNSLELKLYSSRKEDPRRSTKTSKGDRLRRVLMKKDAEERARAEGLNLP
jgi:hypothetical protein